MIPLNSYLVSSGIVQYYRFAFQYLIFFSSLLEEQVEGSLWRPDQRHGHRRDQHQEPGQEGTEQHGRQEQGHPHGELFNISSFKIRADLLRLESELNFWFDYGSL